MENQWKKEVQVTITLEELAVINAVLAKETTAGTREQVNERYKGIEIDAWTNDLPYTIYRDCAKILRRHLIEEEAY